MVVFSIIGPHLSHLFSLAALWSSNLVCLFICIDCYPAACTLRTCWLQWLYNQWWLDLHCTRVTVVRLYWSLAYNTGYSVGSRIERNKLAPLAFYLYRSRQCFSNLGDKIMFNISLRSGLYLYSDLMTCLDFDCLPVQRAYNGTMWTGHVQISSSWIYTVQCVVHWQINIIFQTN